MDFDKLKKAAKDTFKIVTSKIEEKLEAPESESDNVYYTDEPQDTAENAFFDDAAFDDEMEQTQRFDIKNMLDRFKKKNHNINIDDLTGNDDDDFSDVNSDESAADDVNRDVTELKTSIDKIDIGISQITTNQNEQLDNMNEQLDSIKSELAQMREYSLEVATKLGNLDDGINLRLGSVDKKLTDVANAVASVSKLNDSIFDLKNAQMNTKNSISDLEASFQKLKRKMTTSITIISILVAIVAILEIINLLS